MTKDKGKYAALNLSASGNTAGNTKNGSTKSRAQVAPSVQRQPVSQTACELKLV